MYWKVKLTTKRGIGQAELRTCEEADTSDEAIRQARMGAGAAFSADGAQANVQAFTEGESKDPITVERLFIDSGRFRIELGENGK